MNKNTNKKVIKILDCEFEIMVEFARIRCLKNLTTNELIWEEIIDN
jgi:hypothetical protein